ncbi:hypothetical protein FPV67DRAFT_1450218 [Lyophyllum atratum]|nr:hypothetical protein FPV67DRAFT_1450218 [Lyophyllum atratum]
MARPRLYHTPEDIRAANNAKSQRSYVKTTVVLATPPSTEVQSVTKMTSSSWVERIAIKHTAIISLSPSDYMESLYVQLSISNNDRAIQDAVSKFTKLQSSIHRYHAEILQLKGVAKELRRCDEVSKKVGGVLVLSSAILDPSGLAALHSSKQLMYQI